MTMLKIEPWPIELAAGASDQTPVQAAKDAAAPQQERPRRKAVIFVHGIFSSHATFAEARRSMEGDPRFAGVEFHYFDYPYWEAMDLNGQRFADALSKAGFQGGDDVAIVAHSMGGLVARFAILSAPLGFVRIVFLLGTPNAGAIRVLQLTVLLQLLHGATNRFFASFPRLSGIASLSRAAKLIDAQRARWGNAVAIDYLSVPGTFFHQDRSVWEFSRSGSGLTFAAMEVALLRLFTIRLNRPHDGIVEESSNNLITCPRPTEKIDSYGGPRGGRPASYGHLSLAECNEVNHIQIHDDRMVLQMVRDLIVCKFGLAGALRGGLEAWFGTIPPTTRLTHGIKIAFGG